MLTVGLFPLGAAVSFTTQSLFTNLLRVHITLHSHFLTPPAQDENTQVVPSGATLEGECVKHFSSTCKLLMELLNVPQGTHFTVFSLIMLLICLLLHT